MGWLLLCLTAPLMPSQAAAHHSGAMFESSKSLTLEGTVKEFQWTNPHCWIQVLVRSREGADEWAVEMGSPAELFRGGWKPRTLKPGDKIVVTVHPMRDGTHGGLFVSATDAEGRSLGTPRSAPSATASDPGQPSGAP